MVPRSLLAPALVVGTLAVARPAAAATYRVGLGETYRELGALPPLQPGDVVEVVGGFTYQPASFDVDGTAAQPIVIRGLRNGQNQRPRIMGGNNALELAGDHYVVEGLELTGGALRCLFVHAHGLVLRDLLIHDCPGHGIEGGGNGGGDLTLEFSEIHHSGRGTTQHQVYVSSDERAHPGSRFLMRFNWLHDGTGGNNVKSRSERNQIYFNWIQGAVYHELELIGPDPADADVPEDLAVEHSDVVGNVLVKGDGHSSFWITRIGGDGTGQTFGRYRFVHNTIILASDSAGAFRLFDGLDSFEAHDNVIYRTSTAATTPVIVRDAEAIWRAGKTIAGSRNWVVDTVNAVPAEWTGTLRGTMPGWTGFGDYRPLEGSPLVDAAGAPVSPPGHEFPMPLPEPTNEPPLGEAMRPGSEVARPRVGALDLGALELGTGPAVSIDAGPGSNGDGGVGDGDGGIGGDGDGGGGCCQTGTDGRGALLLALALAPALVRRRRR